MRVCVLTAFLPRSLCSLASWGYLGLGCLLTLWAEALGSVSCPVKGSSPTGLDMCGALGGIVI